MESEKASTERLDRVIVFTRYPELGKVKKRLAKDIGEVRALDIHDRLARHAVVETRRWGGDFEIRVTGGSPDRWGGWIEGARWVEQGDGDLGARLKRAVASAFEDGVQRVVVIGTDCPGLDGDVLQQAFEGLDDSEVVFGPALDGGYYLVGLTRPIGALFEGIDWGTDRVLEQSLARVPAAVLLDPLSDVDVVGDLEGMESILGK